MPEDYTGYPQIDTPAPEGIDPYADQQAISGLIDAIRNRFSHLRYILERGWYRNVIYIAGNHWITYDRGQRRYRQRHLPDWFPAPVTNKFGEKYNDLVSALTMKKPEFSASPKDDTPSSVALAEVASRIEQVLWKEAGMDNKLRLAAAWLVSTGNVFLLPSYDEGPEYGMLDLPSLQCPVCGYNDTLSEQPAECPNEMCPSRQPAPDPITGELVPQQAPVFQPSTLQVPKGKLMTDVASPFELYLDPHIQEQENWKSFIRIRNFGQDEAKALARKLFPDVSAEDLEAVGGGAGDESSVTSQLYLDSLAYVTDTFGSPGITSYRGKTPPVAVAECWYLPTPRYPQGLYAIRIGGNPKLTKGMPLPSRRRDGSSFLPVIHIGGDIVSGRVFRKTRLDDLAFKQKQRNLVEAIIMLNIQRMASGRWLAPRGCGMTKPTGDPALIMWYTPISAGGSQALRPEAEKGTELSQSLLLYLDKIDDDMERLAGTFFLQGGEAPSGVTAASALAYLGEKAQRAMSSWFQSWEGGLARWVEQALEIVRTRAPEPRLYIAGRNNRWETHRFVATDLEGEIEMRVEAGSAFPQSQAAVRATIDALIQRGIINPQNPVTAYNILQHSGLAHLSGAVDEDFKIAAQEFDEFLQGRAPNVDPAFDNHFAHWTQHSRDAKSDAYRKLPPPAKAIWTQHALQHMTVAQQFMSVGFTPPGQQGQSAPQPTAQPGEQGGEGARPPRGGTIPKISSPQTGATLEPSKEVV